MAIYNLDEDRLLKGCKLYNAEYLEKCLLIILHYTEPGSKVKLEIPIKVNHVLMTKRCFDLTSYLMDVVKEETEKFHKENNNA